jgi:hypothetical protein
VLSESIWRRRFAAGSGVLGQTILVNGAPATVIGVMPGKFRFPRRETEVWTNLQLNPPTQYGPWFYRDVARLSSGGRLAFGCVEPIRPGIQASSRSPIQSGWMGRAWLHGTCFDAHRGSVRAATDARKRARRPEVDDQRGQTRRCHEPDARECIGDPGGLRDRNSADAPGWRGRLLRSFVNLQRVTGGFPTPPRQMVTMLISPDNRKYQ